MRAGKIQIRRADCHNGPFRRGEEHAHERSRWIQVIILHYIFAICVYCYWYRMTQAIYYISNDCFVKHRYFFCKTIYSLCLNLLNKQSFCFPVSRVWITGNFALGQVLPYIIRNSLPAVYTSEFQNLTWASCSIYYIYTYLSTIPRVHVNSKQSTHPRCKVENSVSNKISRITKSSRVLYI